MEEKLQKLLDKVEYLGWRYKVYEDGSIGLENWSPAGEDIFFETQEGATADSLLHDLYVNADEFDPDEHVEMWVEARMCGRKDVPPARVLAKDADEIADMYWDLFYGVQDAYNGIHKARVELRKDLIDRVNRFLGVKYFNEMTEREKIAIIVEAESRETIFSVEFDDGSCLNAYLCSGKNKYWGDVIWTSHDGKTDIMLYPVVTIDGIESTINGEEYVVEIVGV